MIEFWKVKGKYSRIFLGILLAFSLILNVTVAGYLFNRYGFEGAFDRIAEIGGAQITADREPYKRPVIPEIYLQNQEFATLGFDKHVKDKNDLAAWQDAIRSKVKEIANLPSLETLTTPRKAIVTDQRDLGFGTLTQYSIAAFDGDNIVFFELIPKDETKTIIDADGNTRYPTVLFLPGSGSQGAKDVLNIPSELSAEYYHGGVGLAVAKAGYAVYVIEHRGYGLRSIDYKDGCEMTSQLETKLRCSAQILSLHLAMTNSSLGFLQMADTIQLLGHIRSLNHIDDKRIAIAGLSLGGGLASYISIIDQNLTASVIASGIGSVAEGLSLGSGRDNLRYFDGPDIIAAMAPDPVYISYGKQEYGMFRFEAETGYTYQKALKAYEMLDARDNLVYVAHEGSHEFHIPSLLSFLDRTLG